MAICVACGLQVVNGVLSVDPCTDGAIGCGNTAADTQCLYVKLQPNGGITYDPAGNDQFGNPGGGLKINLTPGQAGGAGNAILGSCLQTDADGKINVRVDATPAGCNAIQCSDEGLFAPCMQGIHDIDQAIGIAGGGIPLAINAFGNAQFDLESSRTWRVCNVGCCPMQGRMIFEAGGFAIDMSPGFLAYGQLVVSYDGGATYGGIFPEHFDWYDNRGIAVTRRMSLTLFHETQWIALDPGQCQNFTPAYRIKVLQGNGVIDTFGAFAGFEFHVDLLPIGQCGSCANISSGDINNPFTGSRGSGTNDSVSLSHIDR